MRALDPGVVTLWRLRAALRSLLFGLPFAALAAVALGRFVHVSLAIFLLSAWVFLFAVRVLLWPHLSFLCYRFALGPRDLRVASGVIFRQETLVPYSRIQFVDTHQGPIERMLGLSGVYVYTASGPAPDGGIPGLRVEEAARLREELAHAAPPQDDDGI
jgi:hypothetical protein